MKRADREGHCRVFMPDGTYVLTREHYEPLRAAWMRGAAFYDAVDMYGASVTIKLARVEAVADLAPDVCQAALDDEEEDRRERALRGEE